MSASETTAGTSAEDSYVYDEATGEWVAAGAGADKDASEDGVVVRDSVGNVLADGDQVTPSVPARYSERFSGFLFSAFFSAKASAAVMYSRASS